VNGEYEFLTPDTVVGYLRARPAAVGDSGIDLDDVTSIEEVGDGNLNLVFITHDGAGRGVVLKQSLPYVRLVGPGWPMTPERSQRETDALVAHAAIDPAHVPTVYDYDAERHVIAMEDLSDHRVWRGVLVGGERIDGVAAAMGRYVGGYAFETSILAMTGEDHKAALARAVNPELCRITEDLVFTEPFVGPFDETGRNSFDAVNAADVAALAADSVMLAEMAHAKWRFMTAAEALIHGDLHTGSVMIRPPSPGRPVSAKAIDPEFSFYGPVAFDLGNLWANYAFAAARALALGDGEGAAWCAAQAGETWRAFEDEFGSRWPRRSQPELFGDLARDRLVATWRTETWLFAAAELCRRIVGLAKVADIENLAPTVKVGAVRGVLATARELVRARHDDSSPEHFASIVLDSLRQHVTPAG